MGIEISCVFDTFDDAERAFIRLRRAQTGIRLLGIGPSTNVGKRAHREGGPAAFPTMSGGTTMVNGLYNPFPMEIEDRGENHREPAERREVRLRVSAADDYAAKGAVRFFVACGARGIRRNNHATWS